MITFITLGKWVCARCMTPDGKSTKNDLNEPKVEGAAVEVKKDLVETIVNNIVEVKPETKQAVTKAESVPVVEEKVENGSTDDQAEASQQVETAIGAHNNNEENMRDDDLDRESDGQATIPDSPSSTTNEKENEEVNNNRNQIILNSAPIAKISHPLNENGESRQSVDLADK